jgi:hypothetical protein
MSRELAVCEPHFLSQNEITERGLHVPVRTELFQDSAERHKYRHYDGLVVIEGLLLVDEEDGDRRKAEGHGKATADGSSGPECQLELLRAPTTPRFIMLYRVSSSLALVHDGQLRNTLFPRSPWPL